jgi:acyl-CoA synthetase (NDP forming)
MNDWHSIWALIQLRGQFAVETKDRMRRLMAPRSIAFIGGGVAEMAVRRCQELGFDGEMWAVHPSREQLAGIRCYPTIDDLPSVPDAAYIGVNRELTIDVVGKLSIAGAGGCVCYAAGFAEVGGEGTNLQAKLQEAAGTMPVVGPNTFGFVNRLERFALWPYLFGGERVDRGPALVSQSGNIGMNLTMNQRSVNFTYVIGAGNQAVLGPGHYIDALLDDDRVTAIGMYIEGFDDIDHFSRAALRAFEKGVPIVVIKAGITEASARQTSSHTSALTGSDDLYNALFERLGVIRVDSLNRLLETLKILDLAGDISGRDILTLSCSGGEAALIADRAPDYGLTLPEFSEQQAAKLEAQFPAYVTVSNPFDYNTSIWADRDGLEACFTTSMQGDHDAAFLVYDHPTVDSKAEVDEWIVALDAFIAAKNTSGKQSFVLCTVSELLPNELRDYMIERGVVPLQGLEDGLYAFAKAAQWHERRAGKAQAPSLPRRNIEASGKQTYAIDEFESKQVLKGFGLRVPIGETGSAQEVPAIAARVGFPVAIKAVGSEFLHKSEQGAVVLGIGTEAEAAAAVDSIVAAGTKSGNCPQRFLVEQMVPGSVAELIVGLNRDPQFGLALVIGSGGILVELLSDSRSLLFPVDREQVLQAIQSLSVGPLLEGFRGKAKGDIDAAIDAIMAVADFAEERWEAIDQLDVNPLMVLPEGEGAIAADALMIVRE